MSKKILIFSKESRGGMETFFKQLLLLKNKGYELSFYFYKKDELANYDNIKKEFINTKYPKGLGFTLQKIIVYFRNILTTFAIIRRSNADILFCVDIYSYAVVSVAKILSGKSKYSFLFLINNNYKYILKYRREKIFGTFLTFLFKALTRVPDKFIFTSENLASDLSEYFRINFQRVIVISHSADIKAISYLIKESVCFKDRNLLAEKKYVKIFYIGRIDVFQKDIFTIIKAYHHLVKSGIKAKLFMIGDGYEKSKVVKKVKKLGLEKDIFFLGWKRNVYKYLRYADIFWFSSFFEGFGMTVVEAMTCGVPVIATDSPHGPSEILENGKYGILVPISGYKKFAVESMKLINSKKLREYYSKAGKLRAKMYDCKTMLVRYDNLFSSLM